MHDSVTGNRGNLYFLKEIHELINKAAGNQIEMHVWARLACLVLVAKDHF